MSRNLGRSGLADDISEGVLAEGAAYLKEDSLLIIDPTDITKKYAQKMEWLAKVRDGSEKQCGLGYWVDPVVGADNNSSEIIPLVHRLYSQVADEFVTENSGHLDSMRTVHDATKGRGIFVLDRGGDRRSLYRALLKEDSKFRFIIRQRGDSHLISGGKLRLFNWPRVARLLWRKGNKRQGRQGEGLFHPFLVSPCTPSGASGKTIVVGGDQMLWAQAVHVSHH